MAKIAYLFLLLAVIGFTLVLVIHAALLGFFDTFFRRLQLARSVTS